MTLYDYILENSQIEESGNEELIVVVKLNKKKLIALLSKDLKKGKKIPIGFFKATGNGAPI